MKSRAKWALLVAVLAGAVGVPLLAIRRGERHVSPRIIEALKSDDAERVGEILRAPDQHRPVSPAPGIPEAANVAAETFAIKLVVLQQMIEVCESPRRPHGGDTYLVDDDESEPLIKALKVRAARTLRAVHLVTKGTGPNQMEWAPGLTTFSAVITEQSSERAVVRAASYSGPLGLMVYTYTLQKDATGIWTIEDEHLTGVSLRSNAHPSVIT